MRSAIVREPIDTAALLAEVSRERNGAALLFVGTVRDVNEGRAVSGIEYTAYEEMAARELESIVREACLRARGDDIVVVHRLGALGLGEASVAIAVAHPHRASAYEASRYIIEEIKKRLPIWKREQYVDGTREWVRADTGKSDAGRTGSATVEVQSR
jgi:molybdopterin synthase catalytic subunit